MSSDPPYRDQVSLLLQLLPIVGREKDFALKGGTAINLFVRDLPRLSVDIDLTFLPVSDRAVALVAIHDGMARLAQSITQLIQNTGPDVGEPSLAEAGRFKRSGARKDRAEHDTSRERVFGNY
jgi:nucleotidyltransferase AbiEii toxin of type IV toxin-antitoxin system